MKTTFNFRAAAVFLAACLCFLCNACGYHMGSMMHPQVKSIAIADIRNDTKEPMLTAILRSQLAEQFQFDGSLDIETKERADCIIYCRVIRVTVINTRQDAANGQHSYRPSEWAMDIDAEFRVIIPGRSEDLIPLRQVRGTTKFEYQADSQVGKLTGMKQACFDLSRQIVQYTTEAW